MTNHSFFLFGPNPNLSDDVRDDHNALSGCDDAARISHVSRMLKHSRYVLVARLSGEPGYAEQDLLGSPRPRLALDVRTGKAWVTTRDGGVTVGCLFALLGLQDLAAQRATWDERMPCRASLAPTHSQLLAEVAEDCLEDRTWKNGDTLAMIANRSEMIEILITLMRRLGQMAEKGRVIRFNEVVEAITPVSGTDLI